MIRSIQALCDIGMVRKNNEDMILVDDSFIRDGSFDVTNLGEEPVRLVAVSDGMGGHNAGEIASEFVLRRIKNEISSLEFESDDKLEAGLDKQIRKIHDDLNKLGESNPEMAGMGCTFTGVLFTGERIYLVHAGDSRLYSLRGKYIHQITKDHTVGKLLKLSGGDANKLVNCFGGGAKDIFFDFENLTSRIEPGDLLMICSDGLSGELSEDELEEALITNPTPAYLVDLAKQKGGRDNISCVIIQT